MSRLSIADRVLELLAQERRVIAADWRFHVLYGRVARTYGYKLPDQAANRKLIGSLLAENAIENVSGARGVYRVIVPFASSLPSPVELVASEANPTAALALFSALEFHGLTVEIPKSFDFIAPGNATGRLPLGTSQDDWTDIPSPPLRFPQVVSIPGRDPQPIHWSRIQAEGDFGIEVGYIQGMPVYVTDVERTLIDSLRFPGKSGGPTVVLKAWSDARDQVSGKQVVDYANRYGYRLLKQRVGFLGEQIGLTAPEFDDWARNAKRGGSAKLIANEPFHARHSRRWSLSINVPTGLLPNRSAVTE